MRHSLLSLLLIVSASASALAQPAPPNQTTQQQVDEYAAAATHALRNGDFDTAIDLYYKANNLDPSPELLYDLAQAYRKKAEALRESDPLQAAESRDRARAYYQKFLDTHPTNDEAELKARGLLSRLDEWWKAESPKEEAQRRAAENAKREAATHIEEARLAEERRKKNARDAIEKQRVSSAVAKTRVEDDRNKASIIEISGAAAMGAGMIGISVGVYYGVKARALSNDLTATDKYDTTQIAKGRQDDKFMAIAYTAGGVLVVGGAIAYWLGHDIKQHSENMARVSLTVAPTNQGAGLLAWGTF